MAIIEAATGKPVQNDLQDSDAEEELQKYDPEDAAVKPDLDDLEGQ
jgi:hypothetical protein